MIFDISLLKNVNCDKIAKKKVGNVISN